MQRRVWTILGLVVFGVGLWLALSLLNLQIMAIFDGITTEQVYTVLHSPTWDDTRISADLYHISMQNTQVMQVSMDLDGNRVQQVNEESKALPETQIGDQFVSPDGAHTVYISGSLSDPTIRLNDQDIAPGLDPTWSPDSTQFAFVNRNSELLIYDVNQNQLHTIYPPLQITCPDAVISSTTELTAAITNQLNIPFQAVVQASTTPPISIRPLTQQIPLPVGSSQPLSWEARTIWNNSYQLDIDATSGGFSTTKSCNFFVIPVYMGGIGLRGGHILATAIMAVGFGLMLPRLLTRKRLWSKIVIVAPFVAALGFEIFLIARLLIP